MEFDKKSLLKLGKLARISISDDKLNNLSKDLNSILEFVDQLKEIKSIGKKIEKSVTAFFKNKVKWVNHSHNRDALSSFRFILSVDNLNDFEIKINEAPLPDIESKSLKLYLYKLLL